MSEVINRKFLYHLNNVTTDETKVVTIQGVSEEMADVCSVGTPENPCSDRDTWLKQGIGLVKWRDQHLKPLVNSTVFDNGDNVHEINCVDCAHWYVETTKRSFYTPNGDTVA
ncbi:MAG: hypothetical protein ATN35_12730 [Epulopiscium sp. Nele67-Bin004]|nr:MAG: hypothetical protein ATN35_12730 [Epulopiscium sp. Nele67-Bin004]